MFLFNIVGLLCQYNILQMSLLEKMIGSSNLVISAIAATIEWELLFTCTLTMHMNS